LDKKYEKTDLLIPFYGRSKNLSSFSAKFADIGAFSTRKNGGIRIQCSKGTEDVFMEKREKELMQPSAHSVTIEGRRRMRITGVIDVESFQEDEMTVITQAGALTVWGEGLKLGKLNPEDGQVLLEGNIVSIEYEQPEPERRSFFFRKK
jgi:sporulation protein YabP